MLVPKKEMDDIYNSEDDSTSYTIRQKVQPKKKGKADLESYDGDSTSYTVRQKVRSKNENEHDFDLRQLVLRDVEDNDDISIKGGLGDLVRKSDVLPLYSNLIQAASTYSRVRSSEIDFTGLSLTTAMLFEPRTIKINRGKTFQVYKCPVEYFPRHYGASSTGPKSSAKSAEFLVLKSITRPKLHDGKAEALRSSETRIAITSFIKELQVLGHPPMRAHQNITSFLGIAWEDGSDGKTVWPVMCLEYAGHGTLAEFQSPQAALSLQMKTQILLDVAFGVEALHMCGIVHEDVKAKNVLVFPDSADPTNIIAKVSDFADVWIVADLPKDQPALVNRGSISECSPEFGSEVACDDLYKIDSYSFGLLVWRVLLDGKDPFLEPFQRRPTNSDTYKSFVLSTKNSDRPHQWASDFGNSLKEKGQSSPNASEIFSLTLQRDLARRSRQWQPICELLRGGKKGKEDLHHLRNAAMLLSYQKSVPWTEEASHSTTSSPSVSEKKSLRGLTLRTKNVDKEISWLLKDEQPVDATDFPELRGCADMEEIDVDFDNFNNLDYRVKKQTLESALEMHRKRIVRDVLQFHLFEKSTDSLMFQFRCYLHGFGVPQDSKLALDMLCQAAEGESEEAGALVKRLHDALAVSLPDDKMDKLEEFLKAGAASGSIIAEEDLARLYPATYEKLPQLKKNSKDDMGVGGFFEKHGISIITRPEEDIPFESATKLMEYAVSKMMQHKVRHVDQLRFGDGNTLLHLVTANSAADCTAALCTLGASPFTRNQNGETPWLVASRSGNWQAVFIMHSSTKFTLPIGLNKLGENPLHWLPVLEKQIAHDKGEHTKKSNTALSALQSSGLLDVASVGVLADIFVQMGANPNQVGRQSNAFVPVALQGAFGYSPTSLTKVHSRAILGTPVHRAVAYGAVDSLRALIRLRGGIDVVNMNFSAPASNLFSVFASPVVSPIQIAARFHRADCLKICLETLAKNSRSSRVKVHGCSHNNVFLNDIKDLPPTSPDASQLAAVNLIKAGQWSLLSEAIQSLPDTELNRLCLHGANHIQAMKDTIDVLLKYGATMTDLSGWGENCIGTAALYGSASTLRYLLELTQKRFIDVPLSMNVAKLTTTPLGIACRRGDKQILDTLLEFGAAVNANTDSVSSKHKPSSVTHKYLSPLHVCAISRHEQIVDFAQILLDRGAEVDSGDKHLPTPLYFALLQGEFELAQLLLDRGADLHARQYSENEDSWKTLVAAVLSRLFSDTPFATGCDPVKILDFLLTSISKRGPDLLLELMD